MKQPPLENHEIQLTSIHRLAFDKLNLTLTRQYQKRGGKGKNAPLIDEYDYNNPSYYGHPKVLIDRLFDKEFMEGMSAEDIASLHEFKEIMENAIAHVDKVKEEIYAHITEHISIELDEEKKKVVKKVKGQIISE